MKRIDGIEVNDEDVKKFRRLANSHRWIFAKTYAAFCPHEYTLRKEWGREDFEWFAKFIRDNGIVARYGKEPKMYFVDEEQEWYYFVIYADFDENGNVVDEMFGVNRGSLRQWEFSEEESLFGKEWRCKRLPKERRRPVK